jgi:hypothetical protein
VSGVDLVQWLGVQLDEDERIARTATAGPWHVTEYDYQTDFAAGIGTSPGDVDVVGHGYEGGGVERVEDAGHIAAHDPARVLRDIDRDRRILIRCQEEMLSGIPRLVHFAKQTVREMALSYEGRPGYAEALASFE